MDNNTSNQKKKKGYVPPLLKEIATFEWVGTAYGQSLGEPPGPPSSTSSLLAEEGMEQWEDSQEKEGKGIFD